MAIPERIAAYMCGLKTLRTHPALDWITDELPLLCTYSLIQKELSEDSEASCIFERVLGRAYGFCCSVESILNGVSSNEVSSNGVSCDILDTPLSEKDQNVVVSHHPILFSRDLEMTLTDIRKLEKIAAYLESCHYILEALLLAAKMPASSNGLHSSHLEKTADKIDSIIAEWARNADREWTEETYIGTFNGSEWDEYPTQVPFRRVPDDHENLPPKLLKFVDLFVEEIREKNKLSLVSATYVGGKVTLCLQGNKVTQVSTVTPRSLLPSQSNLSKVAQITAWAKPGSRSSGKSGPESGQLSVGVMDENSLGQ